MAARRFSRSTPSTGYTSQSLPPEVVQCLNNSRFLHLGTSFQDHPHVSLMNYTFIPAGEALPYEQDDCIIMTTSRDTKKFINICANPRVSILVHDWTQPRPSPAIPSTAPSALTSFLQNINSLQLSSISATLNGIATVLPAGPCPSFEPSSVATTSTASPEETEATAWFLRKHLESNPPESRTFIEKPDVAVIKVRISSARVADLEDRVEKWRGDGLEGVDTPITPTNGIAESAVED